ncbi:nucleoside triphosphate pyrophosphatase [Nesterenkonia sp. F]|uniref:Maf family protein n=1 Tax=Nesterenkonia sp. F TaxID=795955 RepID=UPI000255CF8B|nr:Maf family protein [Nesterenkonia sp. F]
MSARLILGSASPGRAEVLTRAGVDFTVRVSAVDEDAAVEAARAAGEQVTPSRMAGLLAQAKAEAVARAVAEEGDEEAAEPGASDEVLVLGCDSVFELDGVAYGKPHEPEVAVERWRGLRGRTGTLHSGHHLVRPRDGATAARTVSTQVRFGTPSEEQIRAYAHSGEPLGCAGAFTIDGRGAAFIDGVDGDPQSVIGVSPRALGELLAELDIDITTLWTHDR